ncbi:sensor histidine kinase [Paenibacillus elgii]|uniref:histidine kinase n=1 Tax=Paenibacillus elgii TaxID=189691 RepID=A0A2T6G4N5_9BACL|nr:HAMP domain-containing sensor histidine kinase [Paenibacillus elgii]PUA39098.1 sensor histidine kinase [Paenibacillus elgii]
MRLFVRFGIRIVGMMTAMVVLLLIAGLLFVVFHDKIAPSIGANKGLPLLLWMFVIFTGIIFSYILYCAQYLGKPLVYMMAWIQRLAEGDYAASPLEEQPIHKRNGKLKRPFRLYLEVLHHLQKLTEVLHTNRVEREQLDKFKQDWGAGISHDLKTPLTYIKSYSTLLLSSDYSWSDSEKERFVKEIAEKTRHLEELIGDLNLSFQTDFGQLPMEANDGDLTDFVRRIVADVANDPRASEQELEFEEDGRLVASFDPKLLGRALNNLLINAVIHNSPRTRIAAKVYRTDRAHIVIEDNGEGMDEDTRRYLFQRYYRGGSTERNSEGTGLGLAIAKQLVLVHRGDIEVTSEPGVGTTILISLPLQS